MTADQEIKRSELKQGLKLRPIKVAKKIPIGFRQCWVVP